MADKEEKPKNDITIAEMMGSIMPFAWVFDIMSLIPGWNIPNTFIGQFVMSIIWILHGVYPWSKKNWIWYLTTWICEFIPLVSMLPMFTVQSARFFAISRVTDMVKQKGMDSERSKTFVRRFLKTKGAQEKINTLQQTALASQKNDVGRKEKQNRIDTKKTELDTALAPSNPNSQNRSNFSGVIDRTPSFRQRKNPTQSEADPSTVAPTTANDNIREAERNVA